MLAPTGRIVVHTPDVDAARAMLDGRIEVTAGERLTIRHADAAALNAQLVADGVRVFGLVQERSTLEEVVLAATGTGSDRVDAR